MFKRRKQNRKHVSATAQVMRKGPIILTVLGTVFVVTLTLFGSRWLNDTNNFPITQVNVEGQFKQVSAEEIRATVMPAVGSGFFKLDVDVVQQTLNRLAWVDKVAVRKEWPDTLFVRVKEQQALARWNKNGFVNKRGDSFYPVNLITDKQLPWLSGPEGTEAKVTEQYVMIKTLLRDVDVRLTSLTYSARGSWQLELNGEQKIMLGRENLAQRIQRLASLYGELRQSQPSANLVAMDFRYDTGIAVQWQKSAQSECEFTNDCQQVSIARSITGQVF